MIMAQKRPFLPEIPNGSTVIDLTSDSEDSRPFKRPRSESRTTSNTRVTASPVAAYNLLRGPPQENYAAANATHLEEGPSDKHRAKDGRLTQTSAANALTATKASSGPNLHERGSDGKDVSLPKGLYATKVSTFDNKSAVTDGINSLTFRPSPRPQYLSATSPVPKKSRSPDVIDLDTDSDRASERFRNHELTKSSVSSPSPIRKTEAPDSRNVVPATRPFKSHTSSPASLFKKVTAPHTAKPLPEGTSPSQVPGPLPRLPRVGHPPQHPSVLVQVPPHPTEVVSKQKAVIRKLKEDARYIESNSEEVFNATGVKPFDDTDINAKLYVKAAQKRHQLPVDRTKVLLDLGGARLSSELEAMSITPPRVSLVHPRKQTRSILNDRFQHQGSAPLSFENRINDRRINGKFQFISDYVFSRKVQARPQTPHAHRRCECVQGRCGQDCSCFVSLLENRGDEVEHSVDIRSYRRHQQRKGLVILTDEMIEDSTHTLKIFECGDYCSCTQDCINRVVQKGRVLPLQIFETGKYGFGVRSSVDILRGQFIDIYLGEVLTEQEIAKREAAAEEDTPSYIMSLDAFVTDEKSMFYIDGENFGSVTRFVNHSCEPNCKIIPVVLPRGTKHLYYVAFFAVKDIPAGTELTIDYDPDIHIEEEVTDDVVLCQCGSANCRKRLWAPGKEKRGRKKFLPNRDDD